MSNDPTSYEAKRSTVEDQPTATSEMSPLDPLAAAELSQEITLLTRALFAQLLPATAANAISGIPVPDSWPHTVSASSAEQEHVSAQSLEPSVPLLQAPVPEMPPAAANAEAPAVSVASGAVTPVRPLALPLPDVGPVSPGSPDAASAQATPPAPTSAGALPVPSLPVDNNDQAAPVAGPTSAAPRLNRRCSMAMLEEIAFLDE